MAGNLTLGLHPYVIGRSTVPITDAMLASFVTTWRLRLIATSDSNSKGERQIGMGR